MNVFQAGSYLISSQGDRQDNLESSLLSRLNKYHEYCQTACPVNQESSLEEIQISTGTEALNILERINGILELPDSLVGTRDLSQMRTLLSITFRWGIELRPQPESTLRMLDLTQGSTVIANLIIDQHDIDILKACITVGWDQPEQETIISRTLQFLSSLSVDRSIIALASVMASKTSVPYVRRACAGLLSQQLLKPQGVLGLCVAIFGVEESSDDLAKLQHVTKVLANVPSGMSPEAYFSTIIPRIMGILCDPQTKAAYRRAMGFALSRMISQPLPRRQILSQLHDPFVKCTGIDARTALSALTTLVMNADPSPSLLSILLSPVVPYLYSLLFHLDTVKTADPTIRESVRGLLATWARVVTVSEGTSCLWGIVNDPKPGWQIDLQVVRTESIEQNQPLALFTPDSLKLAEESGDFNSDANLLNLYPDPSHFVDFLQSIGQSDLSASVLTKTLDGYRLEKENQNAEPARTLLLLQLVIQMQTKLTSSSILSKPDHILTFVKHALEVPETGEDDSDDDSPDSLPADDEIVETSVHLLLSVLEANQTLSARTSPVLNDIFLLLEPVTHHINVDIRSAAREARMVMTARLASTSTSSTSSPDENDTQEVYQRALKLLQDPILPVRAHGLLLLRQLVHPKRRDSLEPALITAIIPIFLQSIQDEDSYIYLNAVQGLSAMVDSFGKDVLRGLVRDYSESLDHLTEQELDTRLRIGEALGTVIKRCGTTLAAYTSILMPPFLQILRSNYIPTTLRTSAISLLAECESVYPPAMLPFYVELWHAMLDLLQVEVSDRKPEVTEDTEPISKNTKLPLLRRAAIHLLSQFIRETTREAMESSSRHTVLTSSDVERAKSTLGYVASTDEDTIVRVMARETGELLRDMEKARLGL